MASSRVRALGLLLFVALIECSSSSGPSLPSIESSNGAVSWSTSNNTITAKNELISLRWDGSTGALVGLTNLLTGTEFLGGDAHASFSTTVDETTDDIYAARAGTVPPGRPSTLSKLTANEVDGGYTFDFEYDGTQVTVVQHFTIVGGNPVVSVTTDVTVVPGVTVVSIASPEILGVSSQPNESLAWPWHEGVIFPSPGTALQTMNYPSPASMQWMMLATPNEGLYYGVRDSTGTYKEIRFGYDPALGDDTAPREMATAFFPFATSSTKYTTPTVEIGIANQGGWYWGADRYRAFLKSANMVRALPKIASELNGWHKGYGKNAKTTYGYCAISTSLMPDDYTARSNLSLLLMYGWHYDGLDSFYPDYDYLAKNAADPTCLGAGDLATSMQTLATRPTPNRVMFYINGHIADPQSDWMQNATNASSSVKGPDGNPYVEYYSDLIQANRPFQVMCPSANAWQTQLDAVAMKLRNLGPELAGAAGVYWDQVEEMPSVLCFDRTHGHTTPATAFGDGYRALYTRIHQDFSYAGKDTEYVFAAEGANDFYAQFIDVSGGMPGRLFGYRGACGGFMGFPCGATHAPEIGRYTMFAKFLGLANYGSKMGDTDEFSRAFLLGDPLKTMEYGAPGSPAKGGVYATTNPYAFPRYTNIYASEPTIYYDGTYVDRKGLTIDQAATDAMATLIVGANGDRIGVQFWNETNADLTINASVDFTALTALGIANATASALVDLDGAPSPILTATATGATFAVLVPAHDVKAIKISL